MKPTLRSGKALEQWERWHFHGCGRCGRHGYVAARWPDGYVCRTCQVKALRTRGICNGCGTDRMLPSPDQDGTPICRDCAGISRSYFCDRCGFEGPLYSGRLCARCTLTDKVTAALDDGTGQTNPALQPLADALIAMPDPWTGWMWIRRPNIQTLLADLATGRTPLTHQALHELPNWRTVAHLRDLLMACGVLPTVDKQLLHFEAWLTHRLAASTATPTSGCSVSTPPGVCSPSFGQRRPNTRSRPVPPPPHRSRRMGRRPVPRRMTHVPYVPHDP